MTKWIFILFLMVALIVGCGKDSDSPTEPKENEPPEIGDTHVSIVEYTGYGYGPTGIIYCKVTDPDGLGDIKECNWISDVEGYNAQINELYDDGTHGDITANDGTFSLDVDEYWSEVTFWYGDGELNGTGAVYYFEVEDKQNHTDDTNPVEY
jgi:hypothetical protein